MKKTAPYLLILLALLISAGIYLDKSKGPGNSQSLVDIVKRNSKNDVELKNYGNAPEFTNIAKWLNSDPLTMQELRGKVVLIDFWTYSCINCIRTLPYVTGWHEKYKDNGLVVVGVHTPEFAFEKDTGNVQTATKRHGIDYPIAQDNDFGTWRAYNNRYWPAHYLIDQNGKIVYTHFGEGKYQETEQAIQQLLGMGDQNEMADTSVSRYVKTPEIYFGLSRLELLSKNQQALPTMQQYNFPSELQLNNFSLEGKWSFGEESASLNGGTGKIMLNFYSQDVHMVAQSRSEATVKIYIDQELTKTVKVKDSGLYTLFEGPNSKQRMLRLEIEGVGFEAFTFTFG